MLHSSVYAEVGPLTAKYQAQIKNAGVFQIRCNDYTETDMMAMYGQVKKKKRTPSSIVTVAKSAENTYYEKSFLDYWKGMGKTVCLQKGNKLYKLDTKKREGVLAISSFNGIDKNDTTPMSINGVGIMNNRLVGSLVPTALVFIIPDEMKNASMKVDAFMYKYKSSYEENINGVSYQCEEYGIDAPQMKRIYKLYFKDGVLSMYAHGNRLGEVLEVSTQFDCSIFNIPTGFTIYANQKGTMNDLLKTKIVAEQY